jgi:hypothetical protein
MFKRKKQICSLFLRVSDHYSRYTGGKGSVLYSILYLCVSPLVILLQSCIKGGGEGYSTSRYLPIMWRLGVCWYSFHLARLWKSR